MIHRILVRYGIITLGCAIYAFGFNWCFATNHISVGGFTGLGQIINFFLPWAPVGTVSLVLNIPLFILGWRKLGRQLLLASLYAMAVSSLLIDLLAALCEFQPMDPILAGLYGGVVVGVAVGLMVRQGSNTGGTVMAARLLKLRFEGASIGSLVLAADLVVTVGYALVFWDMSRALYGVVALYISSLVMDKVVYGPSASEVAYIISDEYQAITNQLLRMERGVTLIEAKGAFSGEDKHVILCAFGRGQAVTVKRLVREIDPHAFMIVCDAHEILGEGFKTNTSSGL